MCITSLAGFYLSLWLAEFYKNSSNGCFSRLQFQGCRGWKKSAPHTLVLDFSGRVGSVRMHCFAFESSLLCTEMIRACSGNQEFGDKPERMEAGEAAWQALVWFQEGLECAFS